jgi:hypothetical protein
LRDCDRLGLFSSVLPRTLVEVLLDLARIFFAGLRLRGFLTALPPLAGLRAGRPLAATFPAKAPTTPPTTAPIGPATLPIAAPATAPAVCFGIGGMSIFLDKVSSFFEFGFLGMT